MTAFKTFFKCCKFKTQWSMQYLKFIRIMQEFVDTNAFHFATHSFCHTHFASLVLSILVPILVVNVLTTQVMNDFYIVYDY